MYPLPTEPEFKIDTEEEAEAFLKQVAVNRTLLCQYGPLLEIYVKRRLKEAGGKKKSLTFRNGRVSFRILPALPQIKGRAVRREVCYVETFSPANEG